MNSKNISDVFPNLDSSFIHSIENRVEAINQSIEQANCQFKVPPELEKEWVKIIFFSEFIASNFSRDPVLLKKLIDSEDIARSYKKNAYEEKLNKILFEKSDSTELKQRLLDFKVYETIRIAWRDLSGRADLIETLEDLSRLADVIVNTAMNFLVEKTVKIYGQPESSSSKLQEIIVLGMGKLGARELNFSSDIDLIFVYPEEGLTSGEKAISNGEFFTKVCRNFTKFFSAGSHANNFYRVDTRLRPFGDGGPIVMSSQAFEEYYQAQGREWERYAMIKARPIACNIKAGKALLRNLNSFIYRRYFDYGSFDSFRDMKQRIVLQVKSKKLQNNIKLGAGGIREIEFFGQLFQLIRGGIEPRLQERAILKVLDLLVAHRSIDRKVSKELQMAYHFLRRVENRLQAYADLQTHDIPQKDESRTILAYAMGYTSWNEFKDDLDYHMERVHFHFNQLLVTEEDQPSDPVLEDLKEMWVNINDPQFKADSMDIGGYTDPEKVLELLRYLERHPNTRRLTPNGRRKLGRLIPRLIKKIGEQKDPDDILVKLIDLIITIERRTCYLSLLVENASALDTLIILAQKSPWIINFLSGHPALLDELMQPETLYSPPDRAALEKEMAERMSGISDIDFEILLENLCVFRQVNMLRVAAADISGNYPLMKVSDHLTYIAETVLNQVLRICWKTVTDKYGVPEGVDPVDIDECGFAVVAYGKVGGFEMGYKSDIDLVFLHKGGRDFTRGKEKSVDTTTFYSYLGQRIISAMTRHTPAGTLYGADMRLRPGGSSGMIVSQIDGYADYMKKEAWTWEHQALIRARPIAGDKQLCDRFNQIRKQILTRKREEADLTKEVSNMREKMRDQRLKSGTGILDLKQSRGGIVDIEFLVQYMILNHAHSYPDIIEWTDNIRLLESLDASGIIEALESEKLQRAYVVMRQAIHHLNLQEKKLQKGDDQFTEHRNNVVSLYEKYLEDILK